MTMRQFVSGGLLAFIVTAAVLPAQARAQGIPSNAGMTPGSMLANPYANPYMNPFLNPYMTQGTMGRNSLLLYYMSAQQANGGLGSGRISGVRPGPAPSGPAPAAQRRSAAEMPTSMSTPGGGAARYFQRGPTAAVGQKSYYQRHNRYFGNNGR
jgi:hypothetical protein